MSGNAIALQAMRLAIEAARQARKVGDTPFGATLVSPHGEIVHTAPNRQNTTHDCTAHAELVLVREVAAQFGANKLLGATVYASGEPCAMCSGAMFWAGVSQVVFAATTQDIQDILGGASLPVRCAHVLESAQPSVKVEGGFLRDEAVAAMRGH